MSDVLVQVEHLSKKYCRGLKRSLWYGVRDIASELSGRTGASIEALRPGEFHAVNDVSFELRRGECLGLIGPNGAGKSTLLKLLNGLIKPDSGQIRLRGRLGALIELGAGFHPLLTGRENIYVNGAILGMKKREITRRLDEIIDFADIEDAIDTPVRTYSSGMRVRLGFAVAAHLKPDVLLIDEVLAVGDVRFRMKCYERLREAKADGTGIIVVSHNVVDIQRSADKVLLMSHGGLEFLGSVNEGLVRYDRILLKSEETQENTSGIRSLRACCSNKQLPNQQIISGDDIKVELLAEMEQIPQDVRFVVYIDSSAVGRVCAFPVVAPGKKLIRINNNFWKGEFVIKNIPFSMGTYAISACVYGETFMDHHVTFPSIGMLEVAGPSPDPFGNGTYGLIHIEASELQSMAPDGESKFHVSTSKHA